METLAWFFAVSLISTATPGPAVLYVTSQGMAGGLRSAIPSSLGILAADALYILLSISGLTAVLMASYELFVLIKWAGVAYLVYLGLRLMWAGLRPSPAEADQPATGAAVRNAFLSGFALHAGNPKALLYFGSLVPQFVDQSQPLAWQLLSLATIHLLTASVVLLAYSGLAAGFRRFSAGRRVRRVFYVASGSFLLGAGLSLALVRRATR